MAPYETKLSEMQHANFTTYSNLKYYHVIEKPESVKSWERYTQTKQFPIFSICIFILSSCTDLHFTLWSKSTLHNAD
jgi:hypothetical protein